MWLLKAAIFFTLFAFALNNQQVVAVNFLFGSLWKTPLVLVVLAAFAGGLVLGVLLMMPSWWKKRTTQRPPSARTEVTGAPATANSLGTPLSSADIPRHGL